MSALNGFCGVYLFSGFLLPGFSGPFYYLGSCFSESFYYLGSFYSESFYYYLLSYFSESFYYYLFSYLSESFYYYFSSCFSLLFYYFSLNFWRFLSPGLFSDFYIYPSEIELFSSGFFWPSFFYLLWVNADPSYLTSLMGTLSSLTDYFTALIGIFESLTTNSRRQVPSATSSRDPGSLWRGRCFIC